MLGVAREGEDGNLGVGGFAAVASFLDGCLRGHKDLSRRESSMMGLLAMMSELLSGVGRVRWSWSEVDKVLRLSRLRT